MKALDRVLHMDRNEQEYPGLPLPRLVCKDGFELSVQASSHHYCTPRCDNPGPAGFTEVEVGYPSEPEPLLMWYAESSDRPTKTVYGWVPVKIIRAVIRRHSGVIGFAKPWDFRKRTMK